MTTVHEQARAGDALAERYASVRDRISEAARRSGRAADSVILVAVTKYAEPDQIRRLIQMGHQDFGENRVQQLVQRASMIDEWMARRQAMPNTPWPRSIEAEGDASPPDRVRWHMIGHLQRNKARKVVELCRLIHSVDSLRLAEELHTLGVKRETPIDVLVQVNIAGEDQKYGCAVPAARHLAEQIDTMVNVRPRGLMVMAPYSENPEDARPIFERARDLFEEIRKDGVGDGRFNILSMGMSGDYEVAIEEGANLVRVGSGIFGEPSEETRQAVDSGDSDG